MHCNMLQKKASYSSVDNTEKISKSDQEVSVHSTVSDEQSNLNPGRSDCPMSVRSATRAAVRAGQPASRAPQDRWSTVYVEGRDEEQHEKEYSAVRAANTVDTTLGYLDALCIG